VSRNEELKVHLENKIISLNNKIDQMEKQKGECGQDFDANYDIDN